MNTNQATGRTLSPEEVESFGKEMQALRDRTFADLGEKDLRHIRNVISCAHYAEAGGRLLLHFGLGPISFAAGAGALGLSKILENMEIGHNIMHGQYDWTGDPKLQGRSYEWDNVCEGGHWRHSHNYEHHTYTNIVGKDRDVGYGILRVSEQQPWEPVHLAQPVIATGLALLFQWGVALHDIRVDEFYSGKKSFRKLLTDAKPFLRKAGWQVFKDYALFPLLAGPMAGRVAAGNLVANGIRNLWTFGVIFCGHFPDGVTFYPEDYDWENETRGQWYLRQLKGSANISGGPWMHLLTGHLSHQIEHHLFPDIPAARYPQMAKEVRAICEKYGQPYHSGSLWAQLKSVAGRLLRLSLPTPRPKTSSPEAARKAKQAKQASQVATASL